MLFNKAYAWHQQIAIGYGYGTEVEQSYYNRTAVVSGKIYRFPNIDNTLILTVDLTLAHIQSSTKNHNTLTTVAGAPACRAYFIDPRNRFLNPYLGASFGPAYLSQKRLGNRTQGSHFAFQSTIEMGLEVNCIDLNLRIMHYCNAGLYRPNEGINASPVLSIGYLF